MPSTDEQCTLGQCKNSGQCLLKMPKGACLIVAVYSVTVYWSEGSVVWLPDLQLTFYKVVVKFLRKKLKLAR